mmetsp:Transcript_20119/g.37399  ORF Transcript_20119/g.37399 Transcript_20119/m.37399 type:complete len:208 (-) Transcript_20119:815-1438(-)
MKLTDEERFEKYKLYDLDRFVPNIKALTIHNFYQYVYPSLNQHEDPISTDPALSSEVRASFNILHRAATLHTYLPSALLSWSLGFLIIKRKMEVTSKYSHLLLFRPQVLGIALAAYPVLFFTVGSFIYYKLPVIRVSNTLSKDLQDPHLALYRRRLFTNMPEAFNYRYLQDKELRRFDGTLPEEEPDEVAVDNYTMSSELKLDEVSN